MRPALVVIDMLNPYDHADAEPLRESVAEMLPELVRVREEARAADTLIVYVNDCYEDWSAGRELIAEKALAGSAPELVEPIVPRPETPFVVKSRHSIFYGTQMAYLLRQEQVDRVILTGQVTEQCVLYSALDAYVRRFEIAVARDCVAHIDPELAQAALRMMERNMRAHVCPGSEALRAALDGER